jgi:DNA-binding NtrC family response regulator
MRKRDASDTEVSAPPTTSAGPRTKGQARRDAGLSFRKLRLQVISGPDAGRSFSADALRTLVGTHESADLVLRDPAVSRFHFELATDGGRLSLRDLGSTNGTFVNGIWVLQVYLRAGAIVALGDTTLRIDLDDELVRVPLSERDHFGRLVGRSAPMRAAFAQLERAAASDVTVLLEGETGTGKEAAAASIHAESRRAKGPFVVVDCAAIPSDLLESELFGHERGAFTGAAGARRGAFEAASGGTIFLDEIGELGTELQPKLLRALQERTVKRIGSNDHVPVDVRVVAATNRSLGEEVNEQRFRSDLYFRIAVLKIRLPSLRERAEDLPLLVEGALARLGKRDAPEAELLRAPSTLQELAGHRWPGNVRELANYVERCLALREKPPITSEVGSPPIVPKGAPVLPLKVAREQCLREFERCYLENVLRSSDDNVAAAARAAGIDRRHFYRLLERHGLR